MKTLQQILVCALLAALTALAVFAALAVRDVPLEIRATRAVLVEKVDADSAMVAAQISRVVDGQPDSAIPENRLPLRQLLVNEVDRQASRITDKADARLGAIEQDARNLSFVLTTTVDGRTRDALSRVDTALGIVNQVRGDLLPSIQNVGQSTAHLNSIAAHVDDALPAFTDCAYLDSDGKPIGGNPDCLFNRYQGTSKAFETAMQQVAKTVPDVHGIAADFHDATHSLDEKFFHPAPQTQKQKVINALREFEALVIAALRAGVI